MVTANTKSDFTKGLVRIVEVFLWVATAVNLYAVSVDDNQLEWLSKPILMPLLLVIFLLRSYRKFQAVGWWMVAALVFCTLGDIGLLMEKTDGRGWYFLMGIGAFGLAQISYIVAFSVTGTESRVRRHTWIYAPLIAYAALLLYILWPNIPEQLRLPVVGYAVLLISMARTVFDRVHRSALLPALEGAVFFILSDSLIAFNRFVTDVPLGGPLIMGIYVLGQYLLVLGFFRQMKYRRALIKATVVESPGGAQ